MRVLEPFFNQYNSEYSALRTKIRGILQQEDSLSEIVQLVGRESLSEDQKVRLQIIKTQRERERERIESSRAEPTLYVFRATIYMCALPFSSL